MHFYIMSFYLLLGYFSIFPHFFQYNFNFSSQLWLYKIIQIMQIWRQITKHEIIIICILIYVPIYMITNYFHSVFWPSCDSVGTVSVDPV